MSFQSILKNLIDQLDDVLDVSQGNEMEVLESLSLTYKIRHNCIHYILAFLITNDMKLFQEKPLSYYFGNKVSRQIGRKTPDMVLQLDKYNKITDIIDEVQRIILIDISVSGVSNLEREKKLDKYEPARREIESNLNKPTEVIAVAVNGDFSNLEYEIEDAKNMINEFIDTSEVPYTDIRLFLKTLVGVQSKLKEYIMNEELVQNFFQKEFGGIDKDIDPMKLDDILLERLPNIARHYEKKIKINKSSDKKRHESEDYIMKMKDMTPDEKIKFMDSKMDYYVDMMKKLVKNEEIRSKFLEKETLSKTVSVAIDKLRNDANSFKPIKIRPSHQLYTPLLDDVEKEFFDSRTDSFINEFLPEQQQIMKLMGTISRHADKLQSQPFIRNLYENMVSSFTGEYADTNKNVFNTNMWFDKEVEENLKKEYKEYREQCIKNRTPVLSNIEFLRKKKKIHMPKDSDSRAYKQKMIKVPHVGWDEQSTSWWQKAHSGYKEEKKIRLKKTESSCQFEHSESVEQFLDLLTEENMVKKKHYIYDFISYEPRCDVNSFLFLKKEMMKDTKPVLKTMMKLNAFRYLWNQSLVAEQLMHFTQFSLPSNTFSFFTCGIPNLTYIVNNSYHDAGKDVGKAYMCIGYTYDKRWLSSFFGKIEYVTKFDEQLNKDVYYFTTNWRRTETFKLTFLKDQFYSVLSTSMNALLRHRSDLILYSRGANDKDYTFSLLRHHFSLKVCIAMTSNQRIAEMLSDMRYAIMASFSDYSEIDKLILDKFKPKYSTVMEAWIATRTIMLKKQIVEFKDNNNLRTYFKQPVFVKGKRKENSIGGSFELPSIWTGTIIKDLQDLLDDMFIYVHTLKDPSNIHHENVKAVETILEYQNKYDELSEKRKMGNMTDYEDYLTFLLDDNPIGHSSDVVKISCAKTMQTLKAFDLNIHAKKHFFEKVSNVTSTKAAIPEYEREIIAVELNKKQKNKIKKLKKELSTKIKQDGTVDLKELSNDKIEFIKEYEAMTGSKVRPKLPRTIKTAVTKESFLPHTNRSKVHDCILDVLENNVDMSTVFDIAEWNINLNDSRVVSDICIKAQYGAKREFYVINVGAKCNARILENIFSELCKALPNEMISVPGDKKMLVMQDFLNDFLIKKGSNQQVIFVNGDCTKWSAAETMECFMSLISGMNGFLDDNILKYLLIVVDMWANKQITIPVSILQKTFFTQDGKTSYLDTSDPVINSTQNFLQGMFNYMSSFKAVCSSNFTRDIWKKMHPDSKLEMNHLEHSDDYSMIMLSDTLEEAREFRLVHRIIMKMHGFNDSVKKTNTQRFLMEFISLVSLNGHMTYPHIKKLKECGMNLGCTGYRDDVDGAMSRVGEAVRVGSVLSSAYFMQKMHLANVARSYSLLPSQRNSYVDSIENLFKVPVELFGLPDTHPILSFLTKGLANNYRLLNFGNDTKINDVFTKHVNKTSDLTINDLMITLMKIQMAKEKDQSILNDTDFTKGVRLYHPGYIFDIENNLIKKMKANVQTTVEEATQFWEDHKTYNFIKPQNRHLLISWMRSMYFKHNFALAYSRNSRSQITMRLSTFTSKDCCIINRSEEGEFEVVSIDQFIELIMSVNEGQKLSIQKFGIKDYDTISFSDVSKTLSRAVLNCDSSITTIYSMMKNAKLYLEGDHTRSTIAALTPNKVNWLNINNAPDALLQYIFNFEDFLADNRYNKGLPSLEADKKQIVKFYGHDLNSSSPIETIKSVYTDIILSRSKKNLCMTFESNIQNLEDFLRTHLEFGSIYKSKFKVNTAGATESINPHTGEVYYKKLHTFVRNEYKMMIDDAVLIFTMLTQAYKVDHDTVRRVLNNIQVKSEYAIDDNNKITSSDLWSNIKIQDLKTMGCTNNELKSFAFLKNFVTGDIEDIYDIINQDFSYTYQYKYTDLKFANIVSEIVEFTYMKSFFRCVMFKNGHIVIFTTERKKYLLTDAYMIGLKLLNKIKLYELEKNFGTLTLREVQTRFITPDQAKFFLKYKDKIGEFMEDQGMVGLQLFRQEKGTKLELMTGYDFKDDINLEDIELLSSKFFVISTSSEITTANHDFVNKHVTIDFNTMSVYNGRRKVFGLPVMSCQQSNTTEVINDLELNGLKLNWWLDNKRIKKLMTKDDIPISKEEFDGIINFYIRNDKVLLSANLLNIIGKMGSMPHRLFDELPDHVIADIEKRSLKNVSETQESITAFDFLNCVKVKKVDENEEDELLDDNSYRVDDAMSAGSFNAEDLVFDFDLDDIEFEEVQEDSDNDIEDEILRVANDSSDGSSHSKESMIHFNDFQFVVPEVRLDDIVVVSATRTMTMLEAIGDPTQYVINKMYANTTHMDFLTSKEKTGLLYRLNDILICAPVISDIELLMTLTLANSIINSFGTNEEWVLYDDYIFDNDQESGFDVFLKYEGDLPDSQVSRLVEKGGKIKYHRVRYASDGRKIRSLINSEFIKNTPSEELEKYFLVPMSKQRKIEVLDNCSSKFSIEKFLGVKHIYDCYLRLYKESFTRTGFVLELLNELF